MDWYQTVLELIDLRSFSNLWYWMAVAVVWSTASHWILGVPFDLVQRAARSGGQAEEDLEALVRINLNRIFYVVRSSGAWLAGLVAAIHTSLLILGFGYDVEFLQAVFLLAFPMTIIGALNVWTGRRIVAEGARGDALRRLLSRHRLITQVIGVISIFITGLYGMAQNILVVSW
ncbi:MAG: component of SufBCD complex [Pseudomonadota bacterium]